MKKLTLATFLTLGLLFMAFSPSHAAFGTYIDCVHGCSKNECKECCDEIFSDVLARCNNSSTCLGLNSRDFVCPNWQPNSPYSQQSTILKFGVKSTDPTCVNCHDDDRLIK